MKFEEVLPHLKQGKKVRRKNWGNPDFWVYIEGESFFPVNDDDIDDNTLHLSVEDILSSDWIYQNDEPLQYEVRFDIQPLAEKMGISKEQCAELIANEFMKVLGITK